MDETPLQDTVTAVHAKVTLHIETNLTTDGHVSWFATETGEDFLNGPWTVHRDGVADSVSAALKAAVATRNGARR